MIKVAAEAVAKTFLDGQRRRRGLLWAAYRPLLLQFMAENADTEQVPGSHYVSRYDFYPRLLDVAGLDEPIHYLEFGVYKGQSMQWWTKANGHAESTFVGFDSFEGLPEAVNDYWHEGRFSVEGAIPQLGDDRVSFEVGWFNVTVPPYFQRFERRHRLLINLDADIYSSTMLALSQVGRLLKPRDILIFDEFADTVNEFRAYTDFLTIFGVKLRPILQQRGWMTAAFEV